MTKIFKTSRHARYACGVKIREHNTTASVLDTFQMTATADLSVPTTPLSRPREAQNLVSWLIQLIIDTKKRTPQHQERKTHKLFLLMETKSNWFKLGTIVQHVD